MLKGNLKEAIIIKVCNGMTLECESINEALIQDYEKYKENGKGYDIVTYREYNLEMDVEEWENVSLYQSVLNQVNHINELCFAKEKYEDEN